MNPQRLHAAVRVVAATALVGMQLFAAAPAGAQRSGLVQTGLLPSVMTAPTRYLVVDPWANRIFEAGEPADGSAAMQVAVYDLDTLAPQGTIDITAAQSAFGGRVWAMDDRRQHLFVLHPLRGDADPNVLGLDTVRQLGRAAFAITVIDTLSLRVLGTRAVPDIFATPQDLSTKNQIGVKALHYFPPDDALYVVTENTSTRVATVIPGDRTVLVHKLDASKLLDSSEATAKVWSYPIPQCATVMHGEEGAHLLRTHGTDDLFVPCATGGAIGVPPPLDTGGIVRLRMRPGADESDVGAFGTDFFPMSGRLEAGVSAVDPAPGAERFFLRVDASLTGGESGVWVFDAGTASWLGLIVTPGGGPSGLAVNDMIGRLYSLSGAVPEPELHTKAVIASTRTQIADQGTVYTTPLQSDAKIRRPVMDPYGLRLYWEANDGYLVLQDGVPPNRLPPAPDPDAQTLDVDEGPGTSVNFLGGAGAYGSRLRFVGGYRGLERNTNTAMEDDPKTFAKLFLPPDLVRPAEEIESMLPPDPQGGTRDFHFGRVIKTTLGNGEASAIATGADRDIRNTDTDLANWTSYLARHGGPDLTGQRWPYAIAQCTDFGSDGAEESKDGATVLCRRDGHLVVASATNEGPWNLGPLRVQESTSSTMSYRDPLRGVVSVSRAEARGVTIMSGNDAEGRPVELAGIGRIAARAETWAKGRPGTAGSSYVRQFQDVWFVDEDGDRRIVCGENCDPQQIEMVLTNVLSSRVQVSFPAVDARRAGGTPGGFEALVVRDGFERANDMAVNDETDVRLEVPAIEITLVADGRVRSRLVASLAAVAAESHYAIFMLEDELPAVLGGATPILGAPSSIAAPAPRVAEPLAEGPKPLPYVDSPDGLRRVVRKVFDGLRFFLASPAHIVKAAAMWTLLAAPLFLWTRRRSLDALHPTD